MKAEAYNLQCPGLEESRIHRFAQIEFLEIRLSRL